jgi:RecB family exonuclease
MNRLEFDWTVEPRRQWPPRGKPRPPFGPTAIEIMRSCPLRLFFEHSRGYEPRVSFDGRIGIAFHRTLESLTKSPPSGAKGEVAEAVRRRFQRELATQEAEADQRPRELGLPRNRERIHKALEALLLMAQQLGQTQLRSRRSTACSESVADSARDVEVEVEVDVMGAGGLLRGRIDRVEHQPGGVHLFDYKSALRDDIPERYERQVQLYAAMWFETRGAWPARALLVYPLTGSSHEVSVAPVACQATIDETVNLIRTVEEASEPGALATPGDVCRVCSFRPWCQPFWDWQRSEPNHMVALVRSGLGIEGVVREVRRLDHHIQLVLHWRKVEVILIFTQERFPHLRHAQTGDHLRILDAPLRGLMHSPRATIDELSEVFFLRL